MSVNVRRVIVVAVVLIIVVGVIVFRDRMSGNVTELAVGDCFDVPTDITQTVSDIQHHPCTEAHTGEVFGVVTNPADSNAAYPDDATMVAFADQACAAPFLSYVGIGMDQSTLQAAYFVPTSDGWSTGDRTVTCYVLSDTAVSVSVKGSKQ